MASGWHSKPITVFNCIMQRLTKVSKTSMSNATSNDSLVCTVTYLFVKIVDHISCHSRYPRIANKAVVISQSGSTNSGRQCTLDRHQQRHDTLRATDSQSGPSTSIATTCRRASCYDKRVEPSMLLLLGRSDKPPWSYAWHQGSCRYPIIVVHVGGNNRRWLYVC